MTSRDRRAPVLARALPIVLALLAMWTPPGRAELMIVGIDEKVVFDAEGNRKFAAPGKDAVSVVDITDREAPKVVVSFPLMNSIFGPPVNLAVTPDESLAIVANSVDWTQDGANWKPVPDNKLYVFNLKASPPNHVGTVEIGKQPSGLAINKAGNLALVANRADKSISVLSIQGTDVKLIDTVAMGDEVASVAIAPDGTRALVTKFAAHKIALLEIDGQKVTYGKHDMPVGLWPYNIGITPDGKIGISADNGNSGAPDGHIDTVSIIDLEAKPPRVIDRVVVGDAAAVDQIVEQQHPEGIVMRQPRSACIAQSASEDGLRGDVQRQRAATSKRQVGHQIEHIREQMRRQGMDPERVPWDYQKMLAEMRRPDANVTRVISRLYALSGGRGHRADREAVLALVLPFLPRRRPGDAIAAFMDLGQSICLPRGPLCESCPLAFACAARWQGAVNGNKRTASCFAPSSCCRHSGHNVRC